MTFDRYAPVLALLMMLMLPLGSWAQPVSLLVGNDFLKDRRAILPSGASDAEAASRRVASLFVDQNAGSLFAPWPVRLQERDLPILLGPDASAAERIRHLISYAESGRDGYNAVNHGARVRPPKRPTEMSLSEIYRWIADTPGQPHAIGRYQFIPVTLKRLVTKTGTDPATVFTPALQDRLADVLLVEAGINVFSEGGMERRKFMENLAGIWAGLPLSNGQSQYHGFAGNRATMSWDQFDREMAQIFPG